MKDFIIVTDSSSDLTEKYRKEYNVDYIPMRLLFDDKDIDANVDFEEIPAKDFYDLMRNGTRIRTAQVNSDTFTEKIEEYINNGYDVLYISCSSALSASINAANVAATALREKYPDSKIFCVDGRRAGFAQGMICIAAARYIAEGKSIEEVAQYVEDNRLNSHMIGYVDNLVYLKRAGRISGAKALFGGILQKKPIVIGDIKGNNYAVETLTGKKKTMARLVERFAEAYLEHEYQMVCIRHADNEEDALVLKQMVLDACPNKDIEIDMGYVGPIMGASTGPGTLVVSCWGKEVTECADNE